MRQKQRGVSVPHPLAPSPQAGMGGEVKWRTPPYLWEKLKPLTREMRHESTPEEDLLWQRLRNRNVLRLKFRRQHTIDRFILDFYCSEARLAIEVEGAIHQYTQEEDTIRREYLENIGLKVLRFSNEEVNTNLDSVVEKIAAAAMERLVDREKLG
jgi:very-short-patch-repair endonuclease